MAPTRSLPSLSGVMAPAGVPRPENGVTEPLSATGICGPSGDAGMSLAATSGILMCLAALL